ncbi:hypothetical protein DVH24_020319 [Malus domestica]|uniref:Uncharacterized protein n=1 Tax=Malus domestica TaxID=3750 RepID=A0A498J815_MALDO|nr:hypothetical protein DVH24_020319 [Malus domestica]
MRKLLEFDFSTAIDGAVKDEAAKIRVAEDEVSNERTVKLGWHELYGKIGMARSHGARLAQL